MTTRYPPLLADRPRDPRARLVTARAPGDEPGGVILTLECGHVVRRKRPLCVPKRVICTRCPAAGGLGGERFER